MKSTGVFRKIDDLGRIVIPKEIRKTMGIRDGENLEIIIDDDDIKLRKHSLVNNYQGFINDLVNSTNNITDLDIIVTDRDKVIACAGSNIKNEFLNKQLDNNLKAIIDERQNKVSKELDKYFFENKELIGYYMIFPVISDGNSLGLVILYSKNQIDTNYLVVAKLLSSLIANKVDISC
ncbi:MAG: AbrB/MazE/SpoVT family DNA-binding domain-containing protein [Bacilli bacterium]|nr:AbrB/MazE/SpoVT family DNA-binding domain-containing protein [Bacilli bacterium]